MPDTDLSTIDEVLEELEDILEQSLREESPLAIFAFVYRRTTQKIANGIEAGRFEDRNRMEHFDVVFANRYIEAYHDYRQGNPVPFAWEVAFGAAEGEEGKPKLAIMQHVLLGMNAHINLDLGIAAVEAAGGEELPSLRQDFMTVNVLLKELIDEMQRRIGRVSPLMILLDLLGEETDEAIINFSIEKARDFAWNFAVNLNNTDPDDEEQLIREVDEQVAGLGKNIAYPPGFLLPKVLWLIRLFEEKDIRTLVDTLEN